MIELQCVQSDSCVRVIQKLNGHNRMRIHASAITYNNCGVLIRGKSGAGKSTLAHLLLNNAKELNLEAALISDDIVILEREQTQIIASAPKNTFGLIELRGFGLIKVKANSPAIIHCVIDIVESTKLERMPDDIELTESLLDVKIRRQPVPNNCFLRMLLLSQAVIENIPRA